MTESNPTRVEEVVRSGEPPVAVDAVFGAMSSRTLAHIDGFPEGRRIHAALFAVKVSLPAIEKQGDLTFGSNVVKFTRVEDIRKALYPQFAKFGIMSYLELVDSAETLQVAEEPWTQAQAIDPETGKVDRGGVIGSTGRPILDGRIPKTRMWAWVEYRIRYVYIGDGSEVIVGPVKGSAYDTDSDKATGKATTAAIKRLIAETFDVIDEKESTELEETGEDTKNRPETTDRRTAQEGSSRTEQVLAAAAPGASARPGRPSRSRKADVVPEASVEPAPEPPSVPAQPEAPEQPTTDLQQPSDADIAKADEATGEVVEEKVVEPETPPAPPKAPEPDKLAAAKLRIRDANAVLGLTKPEIDAIATEVTGKATREEWIVLPTALAKVADALEARIQAASA